MDINALLIFLFLVIANYLIISNRKFIASKLKIYDYPNSRKIHKTPTPLIGGLCIFTSLIILNFFFYFTDLIDIKKFLVLISVYSIFFLIGLWDDISQISAKVRTLAILIITIILLISEKKYLVQELRFKHSDSIIELGSFALIFTIFCFFSLYNALNFIDGCNGVSISIVIYWTVFLFIANNNLQYFFVILVMLIIFFYNLNGKIFLGNSGTSLLSIFICLSIVLDYNNLEKRIYADEILFLLFFPGIDMIRVTLQRIINKKKIYIADQSHFHHYLLKNDYKFIWLIIFILTVLPIILLNFFSNVYLTLILSLFIYITTFLYIKNDKFRSN